jgi:hypothetical protein
MKIKRSDIQYKYTNWRINGNPSTRDECLDLIGGSFYRIIRDNNNCQVVKVDEDVVTWSPFEISYEYVLEGQKYKTKEKVLDKISQLIGRKLSNPLHFRGKPEIVVHGYLVQKINVLKPVKQTVHTPYIVNPGYNEMSLKSLMMHYELYENGPLKLVLKYYTLTNQLVASYGWSVGEKYLKA